MSQSFHPTQLNNGCPEPASAGVGFGLGVLIFFGFFRPLATSFPHIGTTSILDIFGIGSSYVIIIGILYEIKNVRLNLTFFMIVFFLFYALLSALWGSEYRDLVRMVFPFLPFILASAVIKNEKHIRMVLYALILGYVIPVLGSTILIVIGKSETVMGSNLYERDAGLSSGVHTLGHAMLFFSFIYAFYLLIVDQEKKSTEFKAVTIIFVLSLFCMYRTYTRTVLLGGLIFWVIFLWKKNKRALLLLLVAGSAFSIFYMAGVKNLIWQTRGLEKSSYDINTASSGRTWVWEHNLKLLSDQPITRIVLGVGLGRELDRIPESRNKWVGSHNDYLSLTIMLGIIGIVLYLSIYLTIFLRVFKERDIEIKYLYLSMIISVLIMNFVSNSYIVRFQMAQLFWLFIGIFYAMQGNKWKISKV